MRWRFAEAGDGDDAARAGVLAKIDDWWRAFAGRTADLDALFNNRAEWDLPAWMAEHLGAIDERLMWEFGPPVRGTGHRLVITPEGDRQLHPLVEVILRRAPELPGWEFYPHRLAEGLEMAAQSVQGRTGISLDGVTARAQVGDNRLIDLTFALPACTGPEDPPALHAALVAAESLLGEETLNHWVGAIDVEPAPKTGLLGRMFGRKPGGGGSLPLERLAPTVTSLIEGIRDQLPDRPMHRFDLKADDHPWSNFTREAPEAEDYARRDDLCVAISACAEMTLAQGAGFSSRRFSRFGESFAYVKIDGQGEAPENRIRAREAIEDAIDAALRPAGAGTVVGGGTGRRYTYIDLALADVGRAAELLRPALRARGLPRRTWLLFFDPELADEWVGLHPDTPAPPSAPEDV